MFLFRVPYHLGLRWGQFRRRRYASALRRIARAPLRCGPELPVRLISLSCQRDLPEQIASWRSFVENTGLPQELLLISDGSHDAADASLIQSFHPRARIVRYEDFLVPGIQDCVHRYASIHPFGKKLAIIISMQSLTPCLYSDSDIFYFPGAADFRRYLASGVPEVRYLLDCAKSHDPRLIQHPSESENPVNGGLLYFGTPVDFSEGLKRLEALEGDPDFFSEQTIVHLSVRRAGGKALPPARYVLQADDQWMFADLHAGKEVALRHYISSIRYKMWHHVPMA